MQYSDEQSESLPSSQRIEVVGVHRYDAEDYAEPDADEAPVEEEFVMEQEDDEEEQNPAQTVPVVTAYHPPHDTPVDNHEASFPQVGEEEPYTHEEFHYDPFQPAEANDSDAPPAAYITLHEGAAVEVTYNSQIEASSSNVQDVAAPQQEGALAPYHPAVEAPASSGYGQPQHGGGRRRSASSAMTLDRLLQLHGGSASEQPSNAGAGPDEVRSVVYGIIDQHNRTVPAWESKVKVAEVYRDKPTRTGGRRAPLRSTDKAFLERAEKGITDHLNQLYDTRAFLSHQEAIYEDTAPVFQARSTADRRASEANETWIAECQRMSAQLLGFISQAEALMRRVDHLLTGSQDGVDVYLPKRNGPAQERGRASSRRGSRSGSVYGPAPSAPRSHSRRGSVQRADGQLTLANGVGEGSSRRASASVQRSGGALITPGHSQAEVGPHSTNGGPSEVGVENTGSSPSSIQRGGRRQMVIPGVRGASRRSASRNGKSRSEQRDISPARVVHPDTVVSGTGEAGSPYDRRSPYGRFSPARRQSLGQPGNPQQARIEGSHQPPQRMITYAGSNDGNQSTNRDNNQQLQPYGGPNGCRTELITYSSPRGSAEPCTPEPALNDTQRSQLLLTIEYFEKNAASLRKADLKTARDCFVELYGQQRGLRQYCNWIDDLALQALRQNR